MNGFFIYDFAFPQLKKESELIDMRLKIPFLRNTIGLSERAWSKAPPSCFFER
jgi:hypothetical protein